MKIEAWPCRWIEKPGEQRRVPVGCSGVGGLVVRDVAGGIGKHIIVDVGIFEGRDSILVDPPNQEDCSEKKRKSEDDSW